MKNKSSKTKKWKLQVIHALDFPPNSCSLLSLPGCGSLCGFMHIYLILITCPACQDLILGNLTAGARGALAH